MTKRQGKISALLIMARLAKEKTNAKNHVQYMAAWELKAFAEIAEELTLDARLLQKEEARAAEKKRLAAEKSPKTPH